MSIEDAARAAVVLWTQPDAIIMVAIAGAESGWRNDAPSSSDVWGMPGEQPSWRPYSCNQVYSWGLWQIFMPMHYDKLQAATGSADPCYWAGWLKGPASNAHIADQILRTQGFTAWSTYNNLAYRAYLHDAEVAVAAAIGEVLPPAPPMPPPIPPWPVVPVSTSLLYVSPLAPPAGAQGGFRDITPVEPPSSW